MVAMRWLVVAVVLSGTGTASATVRLCLGPPTGPIFPAPPNPSFVIPNDEVEAETMTAIDDYWSRVTVRAKPGRVIVRGFGCWRKRYRVTTAWTNRASPPAPIESELEARDETVFVRWQLAPQPAWTRVDWAYRAEDLDNDLHGSFLVEESAWGRDPSTAGLDVTPGVRVIHVRLTRFHLDGTQQVWRGWLDRDGDHVRIGVGTPPAVEASSRGPCNGGGRAVPTTPTFRSYRGDTPRFVAMTCDGRLLPITRSVGDEPSPNVFTTVSARDGERFRLRRLPLAPGAPTEPLLVATTDRFRDVAPVVVSASALGCSARLEMADSATWDQLEVASIALDGSNATNEERYRNLANDVIVPTLIASPQLVRITPIWGSQRGKPWFGWVHSDGCELASIGVAAAPVTEPIEPIEPIAPRVVAKPSPRRWPALLALLGLVLGWVVLRRLTRTNAGG
jgi:hypothetical protein